MQDSELPEDDLIELHRLFLELRATTLPAARLAAAFHIVQHPGSKPVLKVAFRAAHVPRGADAGDVHAEAILQMAKRLCGPALKYKDEGAARFGRWYLGLCRNVLRNASRKYRRRRRTRSIQPVDKENWPAPSDRTLVETWWDDVLLGISQIRSAKTKAVMSALANGDSACQIAQHLKISEARVSQLYERGLEILRRWLRRLID